MSDDLPELERQREQLREEVMREREAVNELLDELASWEKANAIQANRQGDFFA